MNKNRFDWRCNATAKNGKPCGAAAMEGGLCFFHANPNKASELGRIGGRRNRSAVQEHHSLPNLDSALAVRQTVARLVEEVYTGELHPRIATGLAPLLNLQLRAIESSDLELRLERIEKLLADAGLDQPLKNEELAPETEPGARPELAADESYRREQ
jgi:hypothetical protein